jgi:hypothetical protein
MSGDEFPDYEDLERWIRDCPGTWVGGLLRAVIVRAVRFPFFANDNALRRFVEKSIAAARE